MRKHRVKFKVEKNILYVDKVQKGGEKINMKIITLSAQTKSWSLVSNYNFCEYILILKFRIITCAFGI